MSLIHKGKKFVHQVQIIHCVSSHVFLWSPNERENWISLLMLVCVLYVLYINSCHGTFKPTLKYKFVGVQYPLKLTVSPRGDESSSSQLFSGLTHLQKHTLCGSQSS